MKQNLFLFDSSRIVKLSTKLSIWNIVSPITFYLLFFLHPIITKQGWEVEGLELNGASPRNGYYLKGAHCKLRLENKYIYIYISLNLSQSCSCWFLVAMALGAKETAPSILFSSNYHSSPKFHSFNAKSSLPSIRLNISLSALKLTLHSSTRKPGFQLQSAVESVAVTEDVERPENRRKLFVLNLPWSFSVADIKKLFGECGAVDDVEVWTPNVPLHCIIFCLRLLTIF